MTKPLDRPHKKPGRKSKYIDEADLCTRVLQMGGQGFSKREMCVELDIGMTTMQRWEQRYPAFRAALMRARELSLTWWERQGRLGLFNPNFKASLYKQNMAARFGGEWGNRELYDRQRNVVCVFDKPLSQEEWEQKYLSEENIERIRRIREECSSSMQET